MSEAAAFTRMMHDTIGQNIAMRCMVSLMIAEMEVTEEAVLSLMKEEYPALAFEQYRDFVGLTVRSVAASVARLKQQRDPSASLQ